MDRSIKNKEQLDAVVLENVSKWQTSKAPLASLTEEQLDVIYQVGDVIKSDYYADETQETDASHMALVQIVDTYEDYIKMYVQLEDDLKEAELLEYTEYYNKLSEQAIECQHLFSEVSKLFTIILHNKLILLGGGNNRRSCLAEKQIQSGYNKNEFVAQFERTAHDSSEAAKRQKRTCQRTPSPFYCLQSPL